MLDAAQLKADTGFPPILGDKAKVLILGTMPGTASLQHRQYYAHPRNAFWPIMGELFAACPAVPYTERRQILINKGIAVWDVIHSCVRPGSLDSAIDQSSVVVNDFERVIFAQHSIRAIFFNGKTAAGLFNKYVVKAGKCQLPLPSLQALPSTSPAHASMTFADKLAVWRQHLQLAVAK